VACFAAAFCFKSIVKNNIKNDIKQEEFNKSLPLFTYYPTHQPVTVCFQKGMVNWF